MHLLHKQQQRELGIECDVPSVCMRIPSEELLALQAWQPIFSLLWLQWFVIGHDCGHRAFSKNQLVEDIVGTLAFMPLIYPFEPWRIKHNHHHAHTNKYV